MIYNEIPNQFFESKHLPEGLKTVSELFGVLANILATMPSEHPAEVAAGFRKLLEAKDCFVRAYLPKEV